MLGLHNLRPTPGARKREKRIGRGYGSGHGGHESTRGTKGQKSRSGGGVRPTFEGGQTPFWMRFPKRGFKNPLRIEYAIVNVGTLDKHFKAGDVVTPEVLVERGIIKDLKDGLKVLGDGELTVALTVRAHKFSKAAREKIEAAGGKAEEV